MICPPFEDLCKVKRVLLDNGYPEDLLLRIFTHKISKFNSPPDKYPKLPWIGKDGEPLVNQIKSCISECYLATKMQFVFSTRCVLPSFQKETNFAILLIVFFFVAILSVSAARTLCQRLVTRIN